MNYETLTIVRLSNFKEIEDVLNHEFPVGTKANGSAVLFAQGQKPFDLNREFTLLALNQLSELVSSMSSIRPYVDDAEIDSELKLFLLDFTRIGTWTLNSASVARSDLKEFYDFDKIELKQMLLNLANKL